MKQPIFISSRQNDMIKKTVLLKKNPSKDAFLLEGKKFIYDIPIHFILTLFVKTPKKHQSFIEQCLRKNIPVYEISEPVMKKICDTVSNQELIAIIKAPDLPMPNHIMLLDGIQDSGNAGTIIRSAAAFGFGCIFSEDSANPYAGKTVRSSAGAILNCYISTENLFNKIDKLKQDGYRIITSELDKKARVIQSFTKIPKMAIVIGNEGQGVRKNISALADDKLYIPIRNTESLNAGVAASILMYHFTS